MADVFISYSRKDIAFARLLYDSLKEHQLQTWIDWEDIPPSADWLAEVYEAIEQADTFIFIISEHSVTSEVCGLEIQHAAAHGKRVIPVVVNEINPQAVPTSLAALNWIFFREDDPFAGPFVSLIDALQTDLEWVKAHTRYLNRALEWERQERDPGVLLRGNDLQAAEAWLAGGPEKDPQPTALQNAFIAASRRAIAQRQRRLFFALLGVFAISLVLGFVSWSMRNTAVAEEHLRATAEAAAVSEAAVRATAESVAVSETRLKATAQSNAEAQRARAIELRDQALSRKLASDALNHLDQIDLALLLGVEASRWAETNAAQTSLLTALFHWPGLQEIRRTGLPGAITAIAFTPDMHMAAFGAQDGSLQLWDWESNQPLGPPVEQLGAAMIDLRFNADPPLLTSLQEDGLVKVWKIETGLLEPLNQQDFTEEDLVLLSPDGERILTGTGEYLRQWDVEDGDKIGLTLRFEGWNITSLAYASDGLHAAAYQNPETMEERIYLLGTDPENPSLGLRLPLEKQEREIVAMLFTRSGETLYALEKDVPESTQSTKIHTFDVASRALEHSRWSHVHHFTEYTLTPDGEGLLLSDGEKLTPGSIHERDLSPGAHGLTATPDGSYLIGGGSAGTLWVWMSDEGHADRHNPLVISRDAWGDCPIVAISHDWTRLVTSCSKGETILWDMESNKELVQTETSMGRDSIFSPDMRRIIDENERDCEAMLWDAETLKPLTGWLEHVSGEFAFSGDSRLFATRDCLSFSGGALYIWDAEDGSLLASFSEEQFPTIYEIAFSPAEDLLAVVGLDADRTKTLWYLTDLNALIEDGETAEVPIEVAYQSTEEDPLLIYDLVFSPNGRLLAMSGRGEVKLFDIAARAFSGPAITAPIQPLSAAQGSPPDRIAFRLDMEWMAVGGYAYQLIDLQNRLPITPEIPGEPRTMAFSPDGARLWIGGNSFLDVNVEHWRALACRIAGRDLTQDEWTIFVGDQPYRPTCEALP